MNETTRSRSDPVALDAVLVWEGDVLAFRHLAADGVVAAGSAAGALGPIPREGFTFARIDDGIAIVTVPDGAVATVRRGHGREEILRGPVETRLARGDALELPLGPLCLRAAAVAPVSLALDAPRGARARGALVHIGMAAAVHLALLGLSLHAARAQGADEAEDARIDTVRELLVSAEHGDRDRDRDPPLTTSGGEGPAQGPTQSARAGNGRAGGGQKAVGEAGKMGDLDARAEEHGRYAVPERIKRDASPSLAREEALSDAAKFGMIGLLGQGPSVPVAAWNADPEAHGVDTIAARGELWSRDLGSDRGSGGLGLSGVGNGGGGHGEGIGLGAIGGLGHLASREGSGTGGDGVAPGGGGDAGLRRRLRGSRQTKLWHYGGDYTMVSGRLPPEAIQRILRQGFGRIRLCYENGLRRNPTLAGRVTVRFVIGSDGSVSSAADAGSDLGDPQVVSCIVRAFYGFSFPEPEWGIVTVVYPLVFSADEVVRSRMVFSYGR